MVEVRDLRSHHQAALEAFLLEQAEGCMHMLSNLACAGLDPGGDPYQGHYAGVFDDGRLIGVAALYWNGMLYIRSPQECEAVALQAVAASDSSVRGFFGPVEQVGRARRALGVDDADLRFYAEPALMWLDLDNLQVPPGLSWDGFQVRRVRSSEDDLMANWLMRFEVEVSRAEETPTLYRESLERARRLRREKRLWGLSREGQLVACCGFSARYGKLAQVGPVWVPPGLRNSGYARTVTAGALLVAREEGVERAVLLSEDPAATHVYLALGFVPRGRQALAFIRRSGRAQDGLRLTA